MLSLEHCRRALPPDEVISEEELVLVREQLTALAAVLKDLWLETGRNPQTPSYETIKQLLDPDQLESVEERAAVLEFDGNYNRDEAERLAIDSAFEM